jgi:hypothetical protein
VRKNRWHNLELLKKLKTEEAMADALVAAFHEQVPRNVNTVRIHVGGDFFSQTYFDAWWQVANRLPTVRFYAYTKSLSFWVQRLGQLPANMVLKASRGGSHDRLIDLHKLPEVIVVGHPDEAAALGLTVDHDDSLAMDPDVQQFALLIHGSQRSGSTASASISKMRKEGIEYGYTR